VLTGAGFCNDAGFSHSASKQDLADRVVYLVGACVVEVFAFQIDPAAVFIRQSSRKIERRRAAGIVGQQLMKFGLKLFRVDNASVVQSEVFDIGVENFWDIGSAKFSVKSVFRNVEILVCHSFTAILCKGTDFFRNFVFYVYPMKYFLVAGEASGDLHASALMRSLRQSDPQAEFRFFGGDLMQREGGELLLHYSRMAYMGFVPVALHLPTILKNMAVCRREIERFRPYCVVLVDYPGFNLRIARFVSEKLHIPVVYYISPTVWAWKKGRIRTIARSVDRLLCILPFEPDFYRANGYDKAVYTGNPVVESVAVRAQADETFEHFATENRLPDLRPIIALLPGSRRQEIKDNLPTMLAAASKYPEYQAVIAAAPGIEPEFYDRFLRQGAASLVHNCAYRLLQQSRAALVTSGTATLETALIGCPQAVCYRTPLPRISAFVWKHFFHVRFISLVNLIAGRQVVQELFNERFSKREITAELGRLLNDNKYRQLLSEGYAEVKTILGEGSGADKAAAEITKLLASLNQNQG